MQPAARLTNTIRDLIFNRPDAADIINDLASSFDAVNVAEPGPDPGMLQSPTAAAFFDAMRTDNLELGELQRQQSAADQLPLQMREELRAAAPPPAAIARPRGSVPGSVYAAQDGMLLIHLGAP